MGCCCSHQAWGFIAPRLGTLRLPTNVGWATSPEQAHPRMNEAASSFYPSHDGSSSAKAHPPKRAPNYDTMTNIASNIAGTVHPTVEATLSSTHMHRHRQHNHQSSVGWGGAQKTCTEHTGVLTLPITGQLMSYLCRRLLLLFALPCLCLSVPMA